jgi:hypothetical protein
MKTITLFLFLLLNFTYAQGLPDCLCKSGKAVIDANFSYAADFKNGKALVTSKYNASLKIEKDGKEIK